MARFSDLSDELDLAVIGRRRRWRVRANPFIGATILVVAADVELDLRAAVPAPTGIEVHAIVLGGRLQVLGQPDWRLDGEPVTDAPLLRVVAFVRLGRVKVDR